MRHGAPEDLRRTIRELMLGPGKRYPGLRSGMTISNHNPDSSLDEPDLRFPVLSNAPDASQRAILTIKRECERIRFKMPLERAEPTTASRLGVLLRRLWRNDLHQNILAIAGILEITYTEAERLVTIAAGSRKASAMEATSDWLLAFLSDLSEDPK